MVKPGNRTFFALFLWKKHSTFFTDSEQHHTHHFSGPRSMKQSKKHNSQGPDKLNTRHLKHIGPRGLVFLTSMLKTALNNNIIPHTWKLANIVHIPKPNRDTGKGISYRPKSVLSVISKTLEKSLLPYITANIPNTPIATWVQNTTLYSDGTTHTI